MQAPTLQPGSGSVNNARDAAAKQSAKDFVTMLEEPVIPVGAQYFSHPLLRHIVRKINVYNSQKMWYTVHRERQVAGLRIPVYAGLTL